MDWFLNPQKPHIVVLSHHHGNHCLGDHHHGNRFSVHETSKSSFNKSRNKGFQVSAVPIYRYCNISLHKQARYDNRYSEMLYRDSSIPGMCVFFTGTTCGSCASQKKDHLNQSNPIEELLYLQSGARVLMLVVIDKLQWCGGAQYSLKHAIMQICSIQQH